MPTFPHIVTIKNQYTGITKNVLIWACDCWSAESYATLAEWYAIDSRLANKGEF